MARVAEQALKELVQVLALLEIGRRKLASPARQDTDMPGRRVPCVSVLMLLTSMRGHCALHRIRRMPTAPG